MNKKTVKTFAGLFLIVVALLDINPSKVIDFIKTIKPSTPVVVVDKPDDRLIELASPAAKAVTAKEDRDKLAVFMGEFGNRKYDKVTMQNLNDIMTKAGGEYFNGSLQNGDKTSKYPTLAGELQKLIDVQEVDSAETILAEDQMKEFSNRCKALAWVLAR